MIRPVVRFPDPRLKRVCAPVDPAEAQRVIADLVDTMRASPGCVGLAAPQIGEPWRVAVVDVTGHRLATGVNGLLALVNPGLEESSERHTAREGCLSLPDVTADVSRASRVLVFGDGLPATWCDGFEARAVQHEVDHLDGILVLDRVTSVHAVHARRK
ncbi:MAG: peptide deformylase [Candidatus Dormibacteria bacterium]